MVDVHRLKLASENAEVVLTILDDLQQIASVVNGFMGTDGNTTKINTIYNSLGDIRIVKENLVAILEAKGHRDETVGLRDEVGTLKTNVENLLLQVQAFTNEAKGYKDSAVTVKTDVTTVKAQIDSILAEVRTLKDQHIQEIITQTSISTQQATIATQKAQTATQEVSNVDAKVALLDALTEIKMGSFRVVDGELLVTHADTITSPRLENGDLIITY